MDEECSGEGIMSRAEYVVMRDDEAVGVYGSEAVAVERARGLENLMDSDPWAPWEPPGDVGDEEVRYEVRSAGRALWVGDARRLVHVPQG